MHVHKSVVAHHVTGQIALAFHGDDIFWCTVDPGWVTGTSYGIISPLSNGLTMVVDQGVEAVTASSIPRRWPSSASARSQSAPMSKMAASAPTAQPR